jgi:hypothetical protein
MSVPGRIFNNTGLGIRGNRGISQLADDLISDLPELKRLENPSVQFWSSLFEALREIPEFPNLQDIDVDLLLKWIDGTEYSSLAKEFYEGNVEKTVTVIETSVYGIPWAVTALVQHLRSKLDESDIPDWLMNVSSFVMHGVPSSVAIFIINLGVNDRQCAIRFAEEYLQFNDKVSFERVKKWLHSLTEDQFRLHLKGMDEEIIIQGYEKVQEKKVSDQNGKIVKWFRASMIKKDAGRDTSSLKVVRLGDECWVVTPNFERVCKFDTGAINVLRNIDMQKTDVAIQSFLIKNSHAKVEIRIR